MFQSYRKSTAGGTNKSRFGFTGLHSIESFDVTLSATRLINNLNQKLNIFFSQLLRRVKWIYVSVIILALLLHAFPAQPHFCPYSHTATELLPSINLLLISQLINIFKIYWIISRGTLLPSTGSKAVLWLSDLVCAVLSKCSGAECNCKTHYQYFLKLNHTLLEKW